MNGRDLIGIAQTGTGKTAAFALPILNQLQPTGARAERRRARARSDPTRELASQIAESFKTFGRAWVRRRRRVRRRAAGAQIPALQAGLDIWSPRPAGSSTISTPACALDAVEVLVLDEVDQMLDLGFVKPIRRIVRELPKQRQNLFFSATMPTDIRELAGELLRDPSRCGDAGRQDRRPRRAAGGLRRSGEEARPAGRTVQRPTHARHRLHAHQARRRPRRADARRGGRRRCRDPWQQEPGPARARARSLPRRKSRAMVATDIAARGIDIDGVTHVINFELPEVAEAYVHRIGRTARAGTPAPRSRCATGPSANCYATSSA